jgi:hypothetical protein
MVIKCFFLLLSIFPATVNAQRICPLDGHLSLLYISDTTEVTIKTLFLKNNLGGTYQFIKEGDTIKCKMYDMEAKAEVVPFKEVPYWHYPAFIKTRNNNFAISSDKNDSIVYDNSGRVSNVWSKVENMDTVMVFSERKYLNDTTVIEMYYEQGSNDIGVKLVALDKKQNIKYIKNGQVPNMITIDQVSENAFYEITRFYYDATRSRINHIQVFDLDKFPVRLKYTQTFEYKNGRPVKSTVKDNIKNKVEYLQEYVYKTVRTAPTVFD